MENKIEDLVGEYPVKYGIEKTPEYKRLLEKKRDKFETEWENIASASKKVSAVLAELDRPFQDNGNELRSKLKEVKRSKIENIEGEIQSKVMLSHNLKRLGKLMNTIENSNIKPLLITRYIEYRQKWESWSFGAGDHGEDIVFRYGFSQALDMRLEDKVTRLGVCGDVIRNGVDPHLMIKEAYFEVMKDPEYPYQKDLIGYLKQQRLRNAPEFPRSPNLPKRGENWEPSLFDFTLEMKESPKEFYDGKPLIECWKNSEISQIIKSYSSDKDGYIQFLKGVKQLLRIINSKIGKVPYHLQEGSGVKYSKKGGPLLG